MLYQRTVVIIANYVRLLIVYVQLYEMSCITFTFEDDDKVGNV